MWQILVSLLSTEYDDIVVDSSLQVCKSTEETCFYYWNDRLFLDGFVEDLCLSFQLVLGGGRLEVLRVPLVKQQLKITGYDPYPEEKSGRRKSVYGRLDAIDSEYDTLKLDENVEINYCCHCYERVYQIRIYMVSVRLERKCIYELIHERGHKLTAFVKTDQAFIYLGRPQRIVTKDTKRSHFWTPSEPDELTFQDFSPRKNLHQQAEESKDLILLSTRHRNEAESQLSTRRIQHHQGVVWDNDAFSNENKRLPIVVHDLDLSFYNFKFIPPKRVKVVVKWGQFVNFYLMHLNRLARLSKKELCTHQEVEKINVNPSATIEVVKGLMKMWISYEICDKERQCVKVHHIRLHVNHYEETLNFA